MRNVISRIIATLIVCCATGAFLNGCAGGSLLDEAYRKRSPDPLYRLFYSWQEPPRPETPRSLSQEPEVVQAIYDVFTTFYRPHDFSALGVPNPRVPPAAITIAQGDPGSSWLAYVPRYAFIQRRVRYDIVDSVWLPDSGRPRSNMRILVEGIVEDFRPDVKVPTGYVRVFLSESREAELTEFLMRDPNPPDDADPYPRYRFLTQYITATPGDWVRAWSFATPPSLAWVRFDRSLERAIVTFGLERHNGVRLLIEKRGGAWTILESQRFSAIG